MNLYLLLKLLHEAAAFAFVAGILGRQLLRYLAPRDEVERLADYLAAAGRFETLMVIPGNAAVIALGALVAWQGGWPLLGFLQGAEANWLLLSNLILLAGLFPVPLIFLPRGRRFEGALREARLAGQVTPALLAALDDPVVAWAHRLELIGLLIVVALMVLKPF